MNAVLRYFPVFHVLSGAVLLFTPAFFTIWAVNRMLWAVTRPPSAVPVQQGRAPLARTIQLAPGR